MKNLIRTFVAVSMLWISQAAYADTFTFAALPMGGNVSGLAGSTVGWGYTLTNQSLTDWLVATNLAGDLFEQGSPNALFDFPILAPGASASVAFDAVAGLGLYELTWDATAPIGFTNSGMFVLSAEWWDGDPFAGGTFIDFASDQSAAYSSTVAPSDQPVPTPEPTSLMLLGVGGALLALCKFGFIGRKLPGAQCLR